MPRAVLAAVEAHDQRERFEVAARARDLRAVPLRVTWIKAHTDKDRATRQKYIGDAVFMERELQLHAAADCESGAAESRHGRAHPLLCARDRKCITTACLTMY